MSLSLDDELAELGVGPVPAVLDVAKPVAEPPKPTLAVVTDLTPHPLAEQWAKWKPRFAEAMDGSFSTIEALERSVLQGRVQFWPGQNAAIITEIQDYPGERALQGLWAAGDIAEVLQLIPGAESFGRAHGCTAVLIEGRAGWARALKAQGYGQWSVTVKKALV